MASDDESDPALPDFPTVASVANKWINMENDHEPSPPSALQSLPTVSKQDVGQCWIDMVSNDNLQCINPLHNACRWRLMRSHSGLLSLPILLLFYRFHQVMQFLRLT